MQTSSYDIIIVGGGMVGAALACALAQQTSLAIAVLESQGQRENWSPDHYHHRVSAIALSSRRIFQSLHVWDEIKRKRVSPFSSIEVWDAAASGEINFDSSDIAEPLLGYIIENLVIQASLEEKLKQYPQVKFIAPIKLTAVNERDDAVALIAADQHVYQAKLIVAADGARSWLREQVGIEIDEQDYEQEAIVTSVTTALPHQQTARQVFLETGPLAFLPLQDEHASSIVWSLPVSEAKRLMALDAIQFRDELGNAFAHKLGEVQAIAHRYALPLRKQQAKNYVKSRIALVGDAAHTIHPLAGQGVNMGLLDAASLADIIVDAINQHRDFSALHNLRPYERWRRADNQAMLSGVDVIKDVFASDKSIVQTTRTIGLNMINRMQWIKNLFTTHAVGKRGGLPRLAV